MKAQRTTNDQGNRRGPGGRSAAWSPGFKRLISVLLVVHLAAVFIGPCAAPPPSSYWARQAETLLEPYLRATFLKDHGYRFFAPNPGPSHLVRYELLDAQGEIIRGGKFPDLQEHWPRLLYHRHFMISESLFNIGNLPAEPPASDVPPEILARYRERLEFRDLYLDSLGDYLSRSEPDVASVRLFIQEHLIPNPEDVAEGLTLDDPSLYLEVQIGEYRVEGSEK